MNAKGTQRLDKVLSSLGVATRSELKKMAKQGRIQVNQKTIKDTAVHVNPESDEIYVDDVKMTYKKYVYWMMNKPQGVISATEDFRDRTVIDLLTPQEQHFAPFPVGRLDKDTEGLLLLTNDGKLAHQLLSPRKHVDKTYFAKLDGDVDQEAVLAFQNGVRLDDGYVTMPAKLTILNELQRGSEIEVTIQEGKFHQVKRMFEAIGCKVIYLKRIRMGTLHLDESLSLGSYRELTPNELEQLQTIHEKKRVIKLLAIDVDGTLLYDDHTLSKRNIEMVQLAAKRGIEIALCTGRGGPNALPVFQKMGLSGTIICHNGAATVVGDQLAIQDMIEIEQSIYRNLLNVLRRLGVFFDVSTAQTLYIETLSKEAQMMYETFEIEPDRVDAFERLTTGIVKVTIYESDAKVLDRYEVELQSLLSKEIAMVRSGNYFIDFMMPTVNKGNGLKNYAKRKGYRPEEIVAIGNYNNDIEMLSFAGIGIAVSNSTEEVLQIADFVVASNNEDGVAEAIEKVVLEA